jgi:hypothetical protein
VFGVSAIGAICSSSFEENSFNPASAPVPSARQTIRIIAATLPRFVFSARAFGFIRAHLSQGANGFARSAFESASFFR